MSALNDRLVTVTRHLGQGERVPPQEADVRPSEVLAALDGDQRRELARLLAERATLLIDWHPDNLAGWARRAIDVLCDHPASSPEEPSA